MFEELIKTLGGLEEVKVADPAQPDAEGYIDRQCPAAGCEFRFKVYHEDWRNIVRDEAVWCAFCGHEAPAREWLTHEQVEQAKEAAFAAVKREVNKSIRRDAESWNRRQKRGSFLTITMHVDSKPIEIVLPAAATEAMQLKITCAKCSCRFAVIGSAFFCPSCGHNEVGRVFTQSLANIRAMLDNLSAISASLSHKDIAQNTLRLMIENGLVSLVTAFQRYAEALFAKQPSPAATRRNVFQNLAEGSGLWKKTFGRGYETILSQTELRRLTLFFQQRHLLAHREGLVDAEYIAKTGDATYREGQRLVVREASVRECLTLVDTLAAGMGKDVP